MRFLENLDYLLHKNKMTRSDLARATGLAPSTVNSWFNRSSDNVTLVSLLKIANYFNVSLDELVNGETVAPASDTLTRHDVQQLKRLLAYYEKIGGVLND